MRGGKGRRWGTGATTTRTLAHRSIMFIMHCAQHRQTRAPALLFLRAERSMLRRVLRTKSMAAMMKAAYASDPSEEVQARYRPSRVAFS